MFNFALVREEGVRDNEYRTLASIVKRLLPQILCINGKGWVILSGAEEVSKDPIRQQALQQGLPNKQVLTKLYFFANTEMQRLPVELLVQRKETVNKKENTFPLIQLVTPDLPPPSFVTLENLTSSTICSPAAADGRMTKTDTGRFRGGSAPQNDWRAWQRDNHTQGSNYISGPRQTNEETP